MKKLLLTLLLIFLLAGNCFAAGNDANTVSLLHMDGVDASTTFTDDAAGGTHTWTANNQAQIDTAQSKFGGASGLFDGTTDWIDTPDSTDFTMGSGDFTVDFWIKKNLQNVSQFIIGQGDTNGATASISFVIEFFTGNKVRGWVASGTTIYTAASVGTITDTNWHHIALVRDGNTLRLFIDGTADGTADVTGVTINDSTNLLAIGRAGEYSGDYFNGWMDEVRVSKGIARWTANFTPPTEEYSADVVAAPLGQIIWIE